MNNWVRLTGWIFVWAVCLFFVQSGIRKLAGLEQMIVMFHDLGYPDWFRIAVGLLEIAGAVLLALPRSTVYAAGGLGVLMIGAVISEAAAGRVFESLLPGQWLIVLALIAFRRIRARTKKNS
jgi:uncharacterized membrane protein YphA (DoxX/SURF4 family)